MERSTLETEELEQMIERIFSLPDAPGDAEEKNLVASLIRERVVDRLAGEPSGLKLFEWVREQSSDAIGGLAIRIGERMGELSLSLREIFFLRSLLEVARPIHSFYLAWSKFIQQEEYKKDVARKDSLGGTTLHFSNPYTLLVKKGEDYQVVPFLLHPAVASELKILVDTISRVSKFLPVGSPEKKFMARWSIALAEGNLSRVSRRWKDVYRAWLRLEGRVTCSLPLEERYRDPFRIRHHPELFVELLGEKYGDLRKALGGVVTNLQDVFLGLSRPHGAAAERKATAISRIQVRVSDVLLGVGGRFFSGATSACVQPNDPRFRVRYGVRVTIYPEVIQHFLIKHEIPALKLFLDLFKKGRGGENLTPATPLLLRGSMLYITAHEVAHLLFRRGIPEIEEPKASILGLYGLLKLYEAKHINEEEWHAVCWALIATIAELFTKFKLTAKIG